MGFCIISLRGVAVRVDEFRFSNHYVYTVPFPANRYQMHYAKSRLLTLQCNVNDYCELILN